MGGFPPLFLLISGLVYNFRGVYFFFLLLICIEFLEVGKYGRLSLPFRYGVLSLRPVFFYIFLSDPLVDRR